MIMKNNESKYINNPDARERHGNNGISNDNQFYDLPRRTAMMSENYGDITRNSNEIYNYNNTEEEDGHFENSNSIGNGNQFFYFPKTQTIRFSEKLVTKVWERPYTTLDEKIDLFYNAEDFSRFRSEYKKYKKDTRERRRLEALCEHIDSAILVPTQNESKEKPKIVSVSCMQSAFEMNILTSTELSTINALNDILFIC